MAIELWKGIPIFTRSSELNAGFMSQDSPDIEMKTGYDPDSYDDNLMGATPDDMVTTPESEDDARFEEAEERQSSLDYIHLRSGQPCLDQNGQGFCWAYSTAMAIMIRRLASGLPYVRLSAHAVACVIKNFRDQGGWCGLSGRFATERGYPSVDFWKEKSMSSQYNTQETWDNAKLHRITEDWYDLSKREYDQDLTKRQYNTVLLQNLPCPSDWNSLAHSMCAIRRVRIERGRWGTMVINSWRGWGKNGLGIFAGPLEYPNNMICTRSSVASLK